MGAKTGISWTTSTWNPVTGCDKVSDGCQLCYAEQVALRFAGTAAYPNAFDVTLRPERLDQPLRWGKPRLVFVNSMSDIYHSEIPTDYVAQMFAVMALAPRHIFQILTKRHGRMRSLLSSDAFVANVAEHTHRMWASMPGKREAAPEWIGSDRRDWMTWPLPNVWTGITVEDQAAANLRIPALMETPAAVRWLSCEPLLGPVNLCRCDGSAFEVKRHPFLVNRACPLHGDTRLDWVVVGGESGAGARPMETAWVESLRHQCAVADVPIFVKQMGTVWARQNGQPGKADTMDTLPEGLRIREFPAGAEGLSVA